MCEAEVFVRAFAFEVGEEFNVVLKPAVPFDEGRFGDAELSGDAGEAESFECPL